MCVSFRKLGTAILGASAAGYAAGRFSNQRQVQAQIDARVESAYLQAQREAKAKMREQMYNRLGIVRFGNARANYAPAFVVATVPPFSDMPVAKFEGGGILPGSGIMMDKVRMTGQNVSECLAECVDAIEEDQALIVIHDGQAVFVIGCGGRPESDWSAVRKALGINESVSGGKITDVDNSI